MLCRPSCWEAQDAEQPRCRATASGGVGKPGRCHVADARFALCQVVSVSAARVGRVGRVEGAVPRVYSWSGKLVWFRGVPGGARCEGEGFGKPPSSDPAAGVAVGGRQTEF